jgi:hypothetical protein
LGRFYEELLSHELVSHRGDEFIPNKPAAAKGRTNSVRKLTCKLASIFTNILTQTRNLPHIAIASRLH